MTLGGLARLAALVGALCLAALIAGVRPAHADRIDDLSKTLASSSNEKTRMAAVVALANMGKPAMKPLVTALADPSAKIRIVAAVALGRLGHKAALPSLRTAASDDSDADVRTKARDAAVAVAKANQLPDPFAAPEGHAARVEVPKKKPRAGFGNQPRALESRPDVYVVIKSSADDSPGKADKKARQQHADVIRQALLDQCKTTEGVTSLASEAQRYGLDLRNVDLSVVKLEVVQSGPYVEIEAQLRLAISDSRGKMLSFLSGGAKVQVLKTKYDARYLPNLRREALENAMRGMFDKLLAHLREKPKA